MTLAYSVPMFSSRLPAHMVPNRLAQAVAAARSRGTPLIDLTVTNPTGAGIAYPDDLLAPLAGAAGRGYEPRPFGLAEAREAVAADYRRRGIDIHPSRIVLTASTSEAYSFLFKLLCDPAGDGVLVPVPSYPLFEHLTSLDGVGATPYALEYHGRWAVSLESVDRAWTGRVRAVLAVSPNNPTGSVVSTHELDLLSHRCASRDAALIVDEVFADYMFAPPALAQRAPAGEPSPRLRASRDGGPADCLLFRLGGLSKSAGLPQVKLGWIAVDGPLPLVENALERLEWICDTYLSVSTPVQLAAPALIEAGAAMRAQILERVRRNHAVLRERAGAIPSIELLHGDGGWSAVLRVPATRSEEDLVVELLERDGVLVHPGFFFDFAQEAFVVISLLPPPASFDEGVSRLLERARA